MMVLPDEHVRTLFRDDARMPFLSPIQGML
jgi:hypothetical protein